MVAKSLFSLTKYNNGFFKSEKQKAFMLAQCQEPGVFYTQGGFVYNNPYRHAFILDEQGIVSVQKITKKKTETVWERQSEDAFQLELAQRLEKDTRAKKIARLYDVACKWNERAEKYKKERLVALVQAGESDVDLLRSKANAYHSIVRKIEKMHQAYMELSGAI